MVGLGRLELPTSPLSGVRSSHLSYRPGSGGAGRDRTGDPLLAKQALSQLSYSPEPHPLRGAALEEIIEADWTQARDKLSTHMM